MCNCQLLSHIHSSWPHREACSPPGFSVYKILQARILEWVAFPFSRGSNLGLPQYRRIACMNACLGASVVSNSVWPHGQQPTRLLCPRDFLGKNTGGGCHFLLHRQIPYCQSHQGIPTERHEGESGSHSVVSDSLWSHGLYSTVHRILQARILEWVALPSSRGSSWPRDRAQVSHIARGFFTSWATREAQEYGVGSLSLLQRIFPTRVSCFAGGFFTNGAIREAQHWKT